MITADYHLHTSFSSDSEAPMESMIRQAISLNLETICFTEHHDIDYPDNPDNFDFLVDLSSYKDRLFNLKEKYKDQIEINYGIELGLMPQTLDKCADFSLKDSFDFIIGSSHIIDNMDPYEPVYFETYPSKKGLEHYFEDILHNVRNYKNYCVYGHLDYAARYIKDQDFHFRFADYYDVLDAILKQIISDGKGIEVNTGGWKYGMANPNPHYEILQRYLELGGEILTIGSDGHCPEHIAFDFHRLPEYLSSLGVRYYTIFRNQKPEFLKL